MGTKKRQSKLVTALLVFTLVLAAFAPIALAAGTPGIRIPVTVNLTGALPSVDEDYTIVLEADNSDYPMPEGSNNGLYNLTISGAGTASLPELVYDSLGIYTYSIYQEPGSNSLATYDDRLYELVVYVTNAEDGGGLVTTVILYLKGETGKLDEVVFENHYDKEPPVLTDVIGSKTWVGGDPEDWYAVELELYRRTLADGPEELVDVPCSVSESGEGKWIYTWAGLPVTDEDGNAYTYFVKEPAVPENYNSTVDGVHAVNTFETGSLDIPVVKIWNGGTTPRPDITIRLLADGVEVDHVVLKDGVTAHVFKGLPVYHSDGTAIVYTITEDEVEGYLTVIDGFQVENTWVDQELPPTGENSTMFLPLIGIMLALAGGTLLRGRKSDRSR